MSHELDNARRTIDKAAEVLERCEQFFRHQSEMNAAAHLSERVMHPPIYASISSVLQGIAMFRDFYPEDAVNG